VTQMQAQAKKALLLSRKTILVLAPFSLLAMVVVWPLLPGRHRANPLAAGPMGGEVHGTMYALIRGEEKSPGDDPYIFLPDITVYLKDIATSATSPEVTTDLNGSFRIPEQPEAQYQLCWKAQGFASGCNPTTLVLRSANINLKPQSIFAEPGVVYGRVALKDGSACRFLATFLGANVFTTVAAETSSGIRRVRANSYGQYVLSALPQGSAKIIGRCEGAEIASVNTLTGAVFEKNLTLPNVKPTALAYASSGGHPVGSVAAGTTVNATVEAKDGGGFPLHYHWFVDPPVSGFTSVDAPTINWKVPGPGLATAYVWAGDERGGNVLTRIALSTSPHQIKFSGHVLANTAPVLAGASVTINGVAGHTNPGGDFILTLPKEYPRYVLTITKPGYQMLSKALYKPVLGATYKLYQAQDFVVDPTKPIEVTEKPPRGSDQKSGIQIAIDANSIAAGADGKGALATSPVHIRALTYNLHDPEDQLPGDYGGVDSEGKPYRLSTLGAANVDIQDAAGHSFNLAPGKTATIKMPIDPAQLAGAPASIFVWHYDTKRGLWLKDGNATRVGSSYEAKVTHFSPVNMDLAFNTGACTKIVVDTGIMPVPFKIRMTPLSGGFVVDANHQNQVIGDPLNVVVREPPGISVRFDMVDSAGNIISGASQTITTGAASPSGIQWNPPPNPPYADCTSEVDYNEQTVSALFPTSPGGFLIYQTPATYLDPAQAPALAAAYYAAIDPGGTKTAANNTADFATWKTLNGFDRTGSTEAIYENEYDLGFGREMHMQTGGQTGTCTNCAAYYVTNYPKVEDAVAGTGAIATVAMEFSPQNNSSGTAYTKFYVYHTDGTIALSADLDGNGQKFVPTLCIICHNGNVSSMDATGNLHTSRFIGFDLQSFRYAATTPRGPQEPSFKAMNNTILTQTNISTPLKLLISDWYGTEGDFTLPNPTLNDLAVPTGWKQPVDESNLYNAVVKTSCRSCHTTRDPNDTGQDISWATYDSLNNDSPVARIYACAPAGPFHHIMPQAQRTFSRFWLSTQPNAPNTIASSDLSGFQSPNNTCQ
jgi:hypothetical protein